MLILRFFPAGDNEAMAKSLILSDRLYIEAEDRCRSRDELNRIGESIMAGREFEFDPDTLRELLREKALLDSGKPRDWVIIPVVFIGHALAIGVFVLIWFCECRR